MTNNHNEIALSEIIGFILLMGLVFVAVSVWVIYVVPATGREDEIQHVNEIKNGFTDYKNLLDNLWLNNETGVTTSTPFNLGTRGGFTQAGGLSLALVEPIPSTGTITIDAGDPPDTMSIDCSSNLTNVTNTQFPLNLTKIKYETDNKYWIQQQFYYQTGGVFLTQDQSSTTQGGVTNRISPPISVFGNKDITWVTIVPIQIDGVGSMSGTGTVRVDTWLNPRTTPLNISYPEHQLNSWVNISVNVADNQTARMWRDLFKGIADREHLNTTWYNVDWRENPQTHRSTAYMYINGSKTDDTRDVYLSVQRVQFYVTLNNVGSGIV